jgi:hypothetical protein
MRFRPHIGHAANLADNHDLTGTRRRGLPFCGDELLLHCQHALRVLRSLGNLQAGLMGRDFAISSGQAVFTRNQSKKSRAPANNNREIATHTTIHVRNPRSDAKN